MDLDQWISKVKDGQHLLEDELQLLCEYVFSLSHTLSRVSFSLSFFNFNHFFKRFILNYTLISNPLRV
jgi:hypothetical protein